MRTRLHPIVASLLLSLWITAGCAGRQNPASELEVVTEPGTVAEQRLNGAVVVGPFELVNPTGATATVDAASYTLVVEDPNGRIERQGEERLAVDVPAGQKGSGKLRLDVDMPMSLEGFAARKEQTNIPWQLTATIKVKSAKGVEEFEAEWYGKLFPPKAPELTVEGEAARSEGSLELRFFVGVANPNPFPVVVSHLAYDLKVLDIPVSKGELEHDRKLDPASGWELEIHRIVGKSDLKDLAKTLLRRSTIPYAISAQMQVGALIWEIPFTDEIKFN